MCDGIDQLPLISAAVAISLAKHMTTDELNLYASLLSAISSEMSAIAAARSFFYPEI